MTHNVNGSTLKKLTPYNLATRRGLKQKGVTKEKSLCGLESVLSLGGAPRV